MGRSTLNFADVEDFGTERGIKKRRDRYEEKKRKELAELYPPEDFDPTIVTITIYHGAFSDSIIISYSRACPKQFMYKSCRFLLVKFEFFITFFYRTDLHNISGTKLILFYSNLSHSSKTGSYMSKPGHF